MNKTGAMILLFVVLVLYMVWIMMDAAYGQETKKYVILRAADTKSFRVMVNGELHDTVPTYDAMTNWPDWVEAKWPDMYDWVMRWEGSPYKFGWFLYPFDGLGVGYYEIQIIPVSESGKVGTGPATAVFSLWKYENGDMEIFSKVKGAKLI